MGADHFFVRARGKSAREVFNQLRDQALYENGHGGYTGTIAEKSDFGVVTRRANETPAECAERIMRECDDGDVGSKWGPAGCIELAEHDNVAINGKPILKPGEKMFLFFGSAPS